MSNMRNFFRCVTAVAAIALGVGCELPPTNGAAPAGGNQVSGAPTAPGLETIKVGDKLSIKIRDIPAELEFEQTVSEAGKITIPYNIDLSAAGIKRSDLETAIYNSLVPKYYRRATIVVTAEERVIYVDGEVNQRGRVAYSGNMTALTAVSAAGGFTDFANKAKIVVTRVDGKKLTVNGKRAMKDSSVDQPVYPGDQIRVERRFW
jgi:protein involved in polysaccharide export with SLBB domain